MIIQQRNQVEEAREFLESLLFSCNWKTTKVRGLKKEKKKKNKEEKGFLHRNSKLNARLTLY
uniref:Putative ovule protein n=1 Tax=Solanum chacoense TaxID=4108 RepID=A0A0V0HLC9_SOLCH